jgi:hypothetical protein
LSLLKIEPRFFGLSAHSIVTALIALGIFRNEKSKKEEINKKGKNERRKLDIS